MINCPKCSSKTRTCDSRHKENGNYCIRVHVCTTCNHKFTTKEHICNDAKLDRRLQSALGSIQRLSANIEGMINRMEPKTGGE